jgi:hypothetical protein
MYNYFNESYFQLLDMRLSSLKCNLAITTGDCSILLNIIKSDVIEHKADLGRLRSLDSSKFAKVFETINYLVNFVGVNEDIHYFRNVLNRFSLAPAELKKMMELAREGRWLLMPLSSTKYHMYDAYGEKGYSEYNLKFISSEGYFEAVYNIRGELLTEETDPINMGTYNYCHPINNPVGHFKHDVVPWFTYNNVKNEPKKGLNKYEYPNDRQLMIAYHQYYESILEK